jgi:zinc protease
VTLSIASLAAAASSTSLVGCRSAPPVRGAEGAAPLVMGGVETRGETTLPNGVRVVIEEHHAAPVVAVQVWVASGAADDPPTLEGAAHLIQRLALRGTSRYPAGVAAELAAVGGRGGGWTGPDESVFHAVVGAPFSAQALGLLADALAAPGFDEAQLGRVKREVLEEIATAQSDPARRANEAVLAALYDGGHASPPTGRAAAVTARTRAELLAQHAARYVASAMTVVVVGDVDAATARAQVAQTFGAIRRGPAPGARAEGAGPGGRVAVLPGAGGAPGRSAQIAVGLRAKTSGPESAAALDLLASALARTSDARLPRLLVQRQQVATAVRAYTFSGRSGSLLALSVVPAPRRIEEAARGALAELGRLAREELSVEELTAARIVVEGDVARGEEGVEGHARRLGFASAIAGDLGWGARYREHLRAFTPTSLRAAAAGLVRADALAVAVALPDGPPAGRDETEPVLRPRLATLLAGASAHQAAEAKAAAPSTTAGGGDLVRAVAPSGVRIVVLRDSAAPRVTIAALWAGGSQLEDEASNGTAALLGALLGRGTRTRSAAELDAALTRMGGAVAGFSDRLSLGLRADFLAGSWRSGLALVADCLLRPSFSDEELDLQRRALLTRLRSAAQGPDAPGRAALRLFEETLWPQQGYRFEPLGTAEAVSALTRVRLLERYRRSYPAAGLALAVVGDVNPAEVLEAVSVLFGDAPPSLPAAPPAPPVAPARSEPAAVFRVSGQGQGEDEAHVVIGFPTVTPADPDRGPLEVLAEILGGEAGRLAASLRDDKIAAHGVRVATAGPLEPGYLAVAVTCAPARVDAVVASVRSALGKIVASGVEAAEAIRAARRLGGARAVDLGSRAAVADALARDAAYGRDLYAYRTYPAALARVTADDVARAARRVLDPQHEIVAVVRPAGAATARGSAALPLGAAR